LSIIPLEIRARATVAARSRINTEIAARPLVAVRSSSRVGLETRNSPIIAIKDSGSMTFTVTNGTGDPRDWVGIFRVGSPDTAFLSWRYLNNTQTRPLVGLVSASVDLMLPRTPGTYECRFLTASGVNTFRRLDTIGPIVVS
jgi:hypothetical protein